MGLQRKLGVILALALLTGCSWDHVNERMEALRGQDIGRAIAKLGYPDSEVRVAGSRYFTWSRREVGSYLVLRYQTKPVSSYGSDALTLDTYKYTTYESVPYELECSLRIFVDEQERITHWRLSGNNGACWAYASRLAR